MAVTDTTRYTQRDGEWGYYAPDQNREGVVRWVATPDYTPPEGYTDPYGNQAQFQGETYLQNPEGDWGQYTRDSGKFWNRNPDAFKFSSAPDYFVAPDGTPNTGTDPYETPTVGEGDITQITAQAPKTETQIGIEDYAGQVAFDPQLAFSNDALLGETGGKDWSIDQSKTDSGLVSDQAPGAADAFSYDAAQGQAATANPVDSRDAATYEANTMFDQVDQGAGDVSAAQGQLSQGAQAEAGQVDVEAAADSNTPLGSALKDFAFLDPSNVDAKATVKGQIDLLQEEFVDSEGNPKIPSWASAAARNVQKIAAFKGITGTAATAAMSQAIMESTIQVAEQDAKFYQTLTLQNLNNQQQATIQRAGILANMDMQNADARTAVAINNSKQFLAMDLANLDNEQQAEVLNAQSRIQALLEDTRQQNAADLFGAEATNDINKFYDTLQSRLNEFNAAQLNAMESQNVDAMNASSQFNSTLEDSRDKFQREMQYAIDLDNAKWRQSVTTLETEMQFEAAAFDARNMVDMTQEQLTRLWDRADSLLDYIWKSGENQIDRDTQMAIAQLQADTSLATAKISAKTSKQIQDAANSQAQRNNWFEVGGVALGAAAKYFFG